MKNREKKPAAPVTYIYVSIMSPLLDHLNLVQHSLLNCPGVFSRILYANFPPAHYPSFRGIGCEPGSDRIKYVDPPANFASNSPPG